MDTQTLERIRQKAYEGWDADGRPHGQELHYWLQAEKKVSEEISEANSSSRRVELYVYVCREFRKSYRRLLLSSAGIAFVTLAFIFNPPSASPPDGIDMQTVTNAIRMEGLYRLIAAPFGEEARWARLFFPEVLYAELRNTILPLQQEVAQKVSETDFSGVRIDDNGITLLDPDRDELLSAIINLDASEEEREQFRGLNKIKHVLEHNTFSSVQPRFVSVYRRYFPFFERNPWPPSREDFKTRDIFGKIYFGKFPGDTIIDSGKAWEFFGGFSWRRYSDAVADVIRSSRILSNLYSQASVEYKSYEIKGIPGSLPRNWIVWYLPVVLFAIAWYSCGLHQQRGKMLEKIRSEMRQATFDERAAFLVDPDLAAVKQYTGGGSGMLFRIRRKMISFFVKTFAILLLLLPMVNTLTSDRRLLLSSFDARAYGWLLVAVLLVLILWKVLGLVLAIWKSRKSVFAWTRKMRHRGWRVFGPRREFTPAPATSQDLGR